MAKNWYATSVGNIRAAERSSFVETVAGQLSAALAFRAIADEQQLAWRESAGWVWDWVQPFDQASDAWLVLFEYATPLVTSRPDLVVVTRDYVAVFEFKTGAQTPSSAKKQALGYAQDLYWFHPGARGHTILPILVANKVKNPEFTLCPAVDQVPSNVHSLTPASVHVLMAEILRQEASGPDPSEDLWLNAQYRPRPSIVDAAVALFAQNEDPGINAAIADDSELQRLTDFLVTAVHAAAQSGQHRLLLVNGVPGAGKTLVGLRLAYDKTVISRLREIESQPLYLTGNGPLVKVLTEALARDFVRRDAATSKESARRRASTLVKLVHEFTRDGLSGNNGLDVPHVAIFDEGQRVWDERQMEKKHAFGGNAVRTEPEVILENLEKQHWAVVVVLVGEGQEINTGEAGVRLWIEAAAARKSAGGAAWSVAASPAIATSDGLDHVTDDLFLGHSRRAEGAAWLSEWVHAVIEGDAGKARSLFRPGQFKIGITRDLQEAKAWLRDAGTRSRYGLVASAHAGRLRPYGIEMDTQFQGGIDWQNWFLDRPPSLESSCALEVAASEFKCQGLELDFVGVCWSWDLVRSGNAWSVRALRSRELKWAAVGEVKRKYGLNAYRVLLTRARAGMVVWVPEGEKSDPTRRPEQMDEVYEFLRNCGLPTLSSQR